MVPLSPCHRLGESGRCQRTKEGWKWREWRKAAAEGLRRTSCLQYGWTNELRMLSSTGHSALCVYLERYGMLVRVCLGRGRNSDTDEAERRQSCAMR